MSDRTETATYVALGVGTGSAILGVATLPKESNRLYSRAAAVRPEVVVPAGSVIEYQGLGRGYDPDRFVLVSERLDLSRPGDFARLQQLRPIPGPTRPVYGRVSFQIVPESSDIRNGLEFVDDEAFFYRPVREPDAVGRTVFDRGFRYHGAAEPHGVYRTALFAPLTEEGRLAQKTAKTISDLRRARLNRNAHLAGRSVYLFGAIALFAGTALLFNFISDLASIPDSQ